MGGEGRGIATLYGEIILPHFFSLFFLFFSSAFFSSPSRMWLRSSSLDAAFPRALVVRALTSVSVVADRESAGGARGPSCRCEQEALQPRDAASSPGERERERLLESSP